MEQSAERGTSHGEISLYESSLAEMMRISSWLENQCRVHNKIFFEQAAANRKSYIEFQNTTGIEFRFISMEVKIIRDDKVIDSFELDTENWKNEEFAKLYFDRDLKENDSLSFNPDTIDYQIRL